MFCGQHLTEKCKLQGCDLELECAMV